MDWLISIFTDTDSVAHIVTLFAAVITAGVLLGKVKIFGISLGVTFVLFCGIIAGHFGWTAPLPILNFMQDFGLILFVFCIGLQVGPGFFSNLKKGGLTLNLLAAGLILLNIVVMFACYYIFFDKSDPNNLPMMIGVLYGAATNTPGLGAANEALQTIFPSNAPSIASGYACAYPLGMVGIILAIIAIRFICRINLDNEEKKLQDEESQNAQTHPHKMCLKVTNAAIVGKTLREVCDLMGREIVCSRIRHEGSVNIPTRETVLAMGDELFVVCAEQDKDAAQAFIGNDTGAREERFEDKQQPLIAKRVVVTRSSINGKKLGDMHLRDLYGVNITRVSRQGLDLFASRNLHLCIGDKIMVVGPEENVKRVEHVVGNAATRLNTPNIATIFIGIFLGIIVGSLPIAIPSMPVPLRLGLAGGPLIVAILIGRFGYRFRLITYTTNSANLMLREIGLVLFLACVGIKAGNGFWEILISANGVRYVALGFLITVIPILVIGVLARQKFHFNYFTIAGMLAGANTNPPALNYACQISPNESAVVAYSAVYPLTMFLRILSAQLLVLLCCG